MASMGNYITQSYGNVIIDLWHGLNVGLVRMKIIFKNLVRSAYWCVKTNQLHGAFLKFV